MYEAGIPQTRMDGICHEELRDSLSHLRHLHLDMKLTAEILELLLELMPNATSIFLTTTSTAELDFLERLPSILEKNRIIHTGAFTSDWMTGYTNLKKFVEITSGTLEELRLTVFHQDLPESACDAIVNCTRLRRLTINSPYTSFDASRLKKLISNSPDLETLELQTFPILNYEDMMHLFELKKLRNLSLTGLGNLGWRTSGKMGSLGAISTLVKLEFKLSNVNSGIIRSLGRLTNLRSLALFNSIDSECFEAICENFESLTELDLERVEKLRDTDGMKLCRFKELRSLSFGCGFGFTDSTFERGVGSRSMKSLSIYGCSLTNAGLMRIAFHHNRSEKLHLRDCKSITDAGVLALLKNEPRLKKLRLQDCGTFRYESRPASRNLCPRLRDWQLSRD